MPTYDLYCETCGHETTVVVKIADRDKIHCANHGVMARRLAAPLFKFAGQVTPGGGPDRFTADMLGIPLKELPAEMKADRP